MTLSCEEARKQLVDRLLDLQGKCYECRRCPLGEKTVEGLDPHVFACGNPQSSLMFVAEAPGKTEVESRIPLTGAAGQFFERSILDPAGLDRSKVYITNAVLCRPNERNRTPFLGEIVECRVHLDAQIMLVSPKLVVTMGNAPLYAVCEEQGITKKRGHGLIMSIPWSDGRRVPVLPMLHPAYNLRGSGLDETRQDVELLGRLASDLASGKEIAI
jgi:uracil-DNA glycosylase